MNHHVAEIFVIFTAIVLAWFFYSFNNNNGSVKTIEFPVSPSKLLAFSSAAVVADAKACSSVGREILQKKGSAVDAAIAASICAGVLNMHSAGVGGGFLMTIWQNDTQSAYSLDARETAPLSSSETMFINQSDNVKKSSTMGAFAIAIPGEIAGYWSAHQRFGKLPWRSLIEPTIRICNEGFEVTKVLAKAVSFISKRIDQEKQEKSVFQVLTRFLRQKNNNQLLRDGDQVRWPKLGETLARIAEHGADTFYNGSLARDIVDELQEVGSEIQLDDLRNYRPIWRQPVVATLDGTDFTLISAPPPGSGAILAYILNIMAGYGLDAASRHLPLTYHRFVEAMKFGYAKRTQLGDVVGVEDLVEKLSSTAFSRETRSFIDDSATKPTSYYGADIHAPPGNHGTSHVSVLDENGNAVSITSTINYYFGSGVMGSRTGIIYNNEMDDFSSPHQPNAFNLPPSPANFIKPGKRPQSSMCPAVILSPSQQGKQLLKVKLVVGAAGGSQITSSTAYVAMRVLMFGEDVKTAMDARRLHHQLVPEQIDYETDMPSRVLDFLRHETGHSHLSELDGRFASVVQSVQVYDNGTLLANSDFRKPTGLPDGY